MRFIQEFGFTIKLGEEQAYQQWLVEREQALAAAAPAGTKYLGTFTTVYTSEKQSGWYKTYLELDSYAAMDTLAAEMKSADSEFGRLMRESSRFGDYDHAAPWSNGLYKAVVDATIWDPGG
ncbi:MAG TPA: hypothetical protein VF365_11485 [Candidatus Limnocylindria bacterium]